jgi:hypothetical protein
MIYRLLLTLIFSTFSALISIGQEIDERLVQNKGELAQSAFKYNPNAYNYMLFELDFGYYITTNKALSKEERKMIQTVPNEAERLQQIQNIGTPNFNYFSLGVTLQSKNKQYFQLAKNQVLVLLPIVEITKLFIQHPSNTK